MELSEQTMAQSNGHSTMAVKSTFYLPQPEEGTPFFDDGREIQLLHYIYSHRSLPTVRNSAQGVLSLIDEYARTHCYLMNVGPSKGEVVSNLIRDVKPHTMVELGGYIGYSAILFADAVRKAGGKRYFTLERNPEFAAVVMSLVDLAGLGDIVRVVVGPSDESLQRLYDDGTLTHIDCMFLDHYKPSYTSDLKLCEHLKLVGPGSVLAADNVIKPGNPPYLQYVRSSVAEKREKSIEDIDDLGGFPDRSKLQYQEREGAPKLNTAVKGNSDLIYESRLVESVEPTGEPDGLEITKCVGEDGR